MKSLMKTFWQRYLHFPKKCSQSSFGIIKTDFTCIKNCCILKHFFIFFIFFTFFAKWVWALVHYLFKKQKLSIISDKSLDPYYFFSHFTKLAWENNSMVLLAVSIPNWNDSWEIKPIKLHEFQLANKKQ